MVSTQASRQSVSVPRSAPRGHVVERTDERVESHPIAGDLERVHLVSGDSGELYASFCSSFPDHSRMTMPIARPSL